MPPLMGEYFRNGLESIPVTIYRKDQGKRIVECRCDSSDASEDAAWELCLELKENGLLAKPTHGNKIRFAPPLSITKTQLDECLEIIEDSLAILK